MTTTSIIICSANKPDFLRETLISLSNVRLPDGLSAEVILVDNKPDTSRAIFFDVPLRQFQKTYLEEPTPGKSHALNRSLSAAKSEILIFTDDDIRFPDEWVSRLIDPILIGKADAVAGCAKIAPHLDRPWMEQVHRHFFAEVLELPPFRLQMTGNNMAIHRRVLEKVPRYDTSLGPGALGFCDDSLFSDQVTDAGFKLVFNANATVEHHFDRKRLLRQNLLMHARSQGRSMGYVAYHYQSRIKSLARIIKWSGRLQMQRLRREPAWVGEEGAWASELHNGVGRGFIEQFAAEYSKKGHAE